MDVIPDIVPLLEINRESNLKLRIVPPPGVPVGDYEVKLKTESYAYNRRVPSEDKIYRISVKAPANIWGTSALIGGARHRIGNRGFRSEVDAPLNLLIRC